MNKKQKLHQTTLPGNGLGVRVIEGDIAYALKQFKRRVKRSGVLKQTFERAISDVLKVEKPQAN